MLLALVACLTPVTASAFSANLLEYRLFDDAGFVYGEADFSDPLLDISDLHQGTGALIHTGGVLNITGPGIPALTPAPLSAELSYFMTPIALVTGSTVTLESLWEPTSLALGDSFSMNALNLDLGTGGLAELVRFEITNRTALAAAEYGQAAGLNMAIQYVVPGTGVDQTFDIGLGSMPTDDVLFRVVYDGSAGTLDALISLDGGATVGLQRSFASVAGPGGFGALVGQIGAGSIVPEPSTSVLLLLGLAALARRVD